jgi:hypothetical protein
MGVEALTFKRSLQGARAPVIDEAVTGGEVNHGAPGSAAVRRALLIGLPIVLAGYALLDRAFAYEAAVPGTPIFAGEMLLLLGATLAVLATGHFKLAIRNSFPIGVLLMFAAWGFVRTVPLIPVYGLDAVRDAALWYYALMAVVVRALVIATPGLPARWARAFTPFVVVLLLWSPIVLYLGNLSGPLIPGSGTPIFSHKIGNIAVDAAIAIGFLWLVPMQSMSRRVRVLLTALATVIIGASGALNRGGAVAAIVAILVICVLAGRRSLNMVGVMVGTVLVGLVLAWGLDLQIPVPGAQGRDISVAQLVQNVASISGASQQDTQLSATVEFRNDLWSGAINLAHEQNALTTGLGFGPNLAQELGIQATPADPLRSPHNSHIDVLVRTGLIGGTLWVAFWVSWYFVLLSRLRRRSAALSPLSAGILKVCVVGVTAILVNAYFDPTLESPQVAIWLWTLVGLGLGIASMRPGSRTTSAPPRPEPSVEAT